MDKPSKPAGLESALHASEQRFRQIAESIHHVFWAVDLVPVLLRLKADERTRTTPVVALTSSKEQSDLVESCQLGVNSYLVKPVNFERFIAAVQGLGMHWLLLNERPSPIA
jgi:DNA-binding response OmpR family regulator